MSKQNMGCYMCGKEYKTWNGLFYHKRKVHNCDNAHSARYNWELKNAEKILAEKAKKCPQCPKKHRKPAMEQHFKRAQSEQFVYAACKLCQEECRTEVYNDHIAVVEVFILWIQMSWTNYLLALAVMKR